MQQSCAVLVVSANVGSVAEPDGETLLPKLRATLETLLVAHQPSFVAVHLQELGGKDKRVDSVAPMQRDALDPLFGGDWIALGLFFNADAQHDFTALGSVFYVRRSISEHVRVYHQRMGEYVTLAQLLQERAPLRQASVMRSRKFTALESPEGGRKGYLQVDVQLFGRRLSFVNVHLPADLDNKTGVAASPSVYAVVRQRLMDIVVRDCSDRGGALIVAGDANVRLDGHQLWADLAQGGDRVEPKVFDCAALPALLSGTRLLAWDHEPRRWGTQLREQPITFAPTYCLASGGGYDMKRCPAWPDRVLYTAAVEQALTASAYHARVWGADHALVYLAGRIAAQPAPPLHHPPDEALARLGHLAAGDASTLRRRRGPGLFAQLWPTGLVLVGATVVGVLMWSLHKK